MYFTPVVLLKCLSIYAAYFQFQHKPEHTYDPLPEDSREKSEIFNELKEWKAEHEKYSWLYF